MNNTRASAGTHSWFFEFPAQENTVSLLEYGAYNWLDIPNVRKMESTQGVESVHVRARACRLTR
jgi:hypothetical protein